MLSLMLESSSSSSTLLECSASGSGVDAPERSIELRRDPFACPLPRDRPDEGRFRFDMGFLRSGVCTLSRLVVLTMGALSRYCVLTIPSYSYSFRSVIGSHGLTLKQKSSKYKKESWRDISRTAELPVTFCRSVLLITHQVTILELITFWGKPRSPKWILMPLRGHFLLQISG